MDISLRKSLLTGCVATLLLSGSGAAAQPVDSTPLAGVVEYPEYSATATAISLNTPTLSAQLTANVDEIILHVGDRVEKGAALLKLDCRDYVLAENIASAEQESADAQLALALSQHNRSQQLLERKLTSQQDADDKLATFTAASAQARLAQARVKQARLNVSRCTVTAPFNGVITARHISAGELATPGTSLYSLVDNEKLEVSARMSEEDTTTISKDTAVTFQSGTGYPIMLKRTVGAIDTETRTRELRFVFKDQQPLPGSAGKIRWQSPAPYLPAKYLVSRDNTIGYFIAENGMARFIPLPGAFPGRAQKVTVELSSTLLLPPLGNIKEGDSLTFQQGAAELAE